MYDNPKFIRLKNQIEGTYRELREMSAIVGNDVQESYVKLEVLILDLKIELYQFLINESNFYNEQSIKILQKKLDYLFEIKKAQYIIRSSNTSHPILLQDIKDFKFE